MRTNKVVGALVSGAAGGAAGGITMAFLLGFSLERIVAAMFVGAISLALAELAALPGSSNLLKALAYATTLGLSISILTFVLLDLNRPFLRLAIPIVGGCLVGGTLGKYLWLWLLQASEQVQSKS